MDALKEILAKKRKAAELEFGGRTNVKRVEIEQARIQQLRAEERNELELKARPMLHTFTLTSAFCNHGTNAMPFALHFRKSSAH